MSYYPLQDPDVRLSKTLSWLLRHGAEKVGLQLDEGDLSRFSDFYQVIVREIPLFLTDLLLLGA